MVRVLELFAGIGGCAAAARSLPLTIAVAVEQDATCRAIYGETFGHPTRPYNLVGAPASLYADHADGLWWASPPCQPFTVKGRQRDVEDPRAEPFLALIEAVRRHQPAALAVENVPGFVGSRVHRALVCALDDGGYTWREQQVCPTELGIPNRRRRWYLWARRRGPVGALQLTRVGRPLETYLDDEPDDGLWLEPEVGRAYRHALDVVVPEDPGAVAACFGSGYGRVVVRSGSYVGVGGRLRRFSPGEVARLLHFDGLCVPPGLRPQQLWAKLGNSLCVPVVGAVLEAVTSWDPDERSATSTRTSAGSRR